MRLHLIAAAAVAMVAAAAASAAAETATYQATGEVDAPAHDVAKARTRALDAAFVEAVDRGLQTLLGSDARRRHRDLLREQVLRRARLFIASYRVLEESAVEGRVRVRIEARVQLDAIRERLAEIGIDTAPAVEAPARAERGRPRVAVLLHATVDGATSVTFGQQGDDGGAAGRAFVAELREQGFDVLVTSGVPTPVTRDAEPGLPLGDEAALALAERAGAGGVFVVGLEVGRDGRVRGTSQIGAVGRASVRVIDAAAGRVVARGQVDGAGYAPSVEQAASAAARDLAVRAARMVLPATAAYWPLPVAADDALLVHIRGFHGWPSVEAIVRQLSSTRGVRSVSPRVFERGQVTLAVSTELGARQVAAVVQAATLPRGRVAARADSDAVVLAQVRE